MSTLDSWCEDAGREGEPDEGRAGDDGVGIPSGEEEGFGKQGDRLIQRNLRGVERFTGFHRTDFGSDFCT